MGEAYGLQITTSRRVANELNNLDQPLVVNQLGNLTEILKETPVMLATEFCFGLRLGFEPLDSRYRPRFSMIQLLSLFLRQWPAFVKSLR